MEHHEDLQGVYPLIYHLILVVKYRWDNGKLRLWRSCKTPLRCSGQGSKNPAPLGAGSSKIKKNF